MLCIGLRYFHVVLVVSINLYFCIIVILIVFLYWFFYFIISYVSLMIVNFYC